MFIKRFIAAAALLWFCSFAHANIILSEDFESGGPGAFSGAGGVESSQGYSSFGAGNYFYRNSTDNGSGAGAAGITSVSFSLGGATSYNLQFDLAAIDSWDGSTTSGGSAPPDFFNVDRDGSNVFSETIDNFICGDGTICGNPNVTLLPGSNTNKGFNNGWPDTFWRVSLDLTGSGIETLNFYASGLGWQAGTDESWAIDNIVITAAVPEPNILGLLALGLLGLSVARRRA